MSSAERFVRHHKLRTDHVISQAYGRLATNAVARTVFTTLFFLRSKAVDGKSARRRDEFAQAGRKNGSNCLSLQKLSIRLEE